MTPPAGPLIVKSELAFIKSSALPRVIVFPVRLAAMLMVLVVPSAWIIAHFSEFGPAAAVLVTVMGVPGACACDSNRRSSSGDNSGRSPRRFLRGDRDPAPAAVAACPHPPNPSLLRLMAYLAVGKSTEPSEVRNANSFADSVAIGQVFLCARSPAAMRGPVSPTTTVADVSSGSPYLKSCEPSPDRDTEKWRPRY